jgi:hypothetical protein
MTSRKIELMNREKLPGQERKKQMGRKVGQNISREKSRGNPCKVTLSKGTKIRFFRVYPHSGVSLQVNLPSANS